MTREERPMFGIRFPRWGFGRKARPVCHVHREHMRPQRARSGLWQNSRDEKSQWRQLVCPAPGCWRYHIETR